VDDLTSCPFCGGQTPANVTVCLRCFANLASRTAPSEPSDGEPGRPEAETDQRSQAEPSSQGQPPAATTPDERAADEPAEGPHLSGQGPAGEETDEGDPTAEGPGLLFPWGYLPVRPGQPLQIGRGRDNPVPAFEAHGNLSRLHARIECTPEGLSVTDLRSTNGTFLNGRRLDPGVPTPAQPGDLIRFAATLEAIVDEAPEE
jgi:hypothetical protein